MGASPAKESLPTQGSPISEEGWHTISRPQGRGTPENLSLARKASPILPSQNWWNILRDEADLSTDDQDWQVETRISVHNPNPPHKPNSHPSLVTNPVGNGGMSVGNQVGPNVGGIPGGFVVLRSGTQSGGQCGQGRGAAGKRKVTIQDTPQVVGMVGEEDAQYAAQGSRN